MAMSAARPVMISVPTTAGPMPGLLTFAGVFLLQVPPYFSIRAQSLDNSSPDAVVGMSRVRKPPETTLAPSLTTVYDT